MIPDKGHDYILTKGGQMDEPGRINLVTHLHVYHFGGMHDILKNIDVYEYMDNEADRKRIRPGVVRYC